MSQKLADGAAGMTWLAWFVSHVTQINEVLQFFALIVAIVSGSAAAWYHFSKSRMP